MQELKAIYDRYKEEYKAVRDKAPRFDGILGFASSTKKDACHHRFFQSVTQWVQEFLAEEPDQEAVGEAVEWILSASIEHKKKPEYWFMYAVHGLCKEMVPLLSADQCKQFQDLYDANFPKRDRMPAHVELYKLLREGAQEKEK